MQASDKPTHTVIVESDRVRLDRWLAERHPEISRARWQEWIEASQVLLNGKPTKPATKLRFGDQLCYTLPPNRTPDPKLHPEPIPLTILYEDEHLLVVDKPRGLTVHPAPGHPHGTLVNALLAHAKHLAQGSAHFRPGIVHRLDKETTGLLIVAKTDLAHDRLSRAIQRRLVRRLYRALVWGNPSWDLKTVDRPIGRHPINRQKMYAYAHDELLPPSARPARTHFAVVARYPHCTLVQAELETGRTHQVRVHANAIGHPVVGDFLYGGKRTPPQDFPAELQAAIQNLQGQLLHAYRLEFLHPITHSPMLFESPLPADFANVLERLIHFAQEAKTRLLDPPHASQNLPDSSR